MTSSITRDEFTELFEAQVRGTVATAFVMSGTSPGKYWPMLRAEEEMTIRAMGEIGHMTGFSMSMQLHNSARENSE